ncbi:MAG TPA: alpha/beta family hydrolase [Solirubrobacteraceae bacterium]|nr:alpha/beta family hydrolase [Solirubrobacteraceae bacterium]
MSDPAAQRRDLLAALLGPPGPELTCEECFDALDRYVDLELDGAAADRLVPGMRAHRAGGPACHEDHESLRELVRAHDAPPSSGPPGVDPPLMRTVSIPAGAAVLDGDLAFPDPGRGLVVFAHGSGSGRHSPRNRAVAGALHARGLGTLLIDLLTAAEAAEDLRTTELRFDVDLLGARVIAAIDWTRRQPDLRRAPLGCFGASTGAAAALLAAAARPADVGAVVSRGGRPDLAGNHLAQVRAPTLLIVGGDDHLVTPLNHQALARMSCAETAVEIVPGAGHLFAEPGALERVAALAGDWFVDHLR